AEPALVFGDQPRLKRSVAIARDINRQRTIVGQHRLAARAITMIRGVVRFVAARWVAEMVTQLAAQRALDQCFLERAHGGIELLGGNRSLADELIEYLARDRREWRVRRQAF